MPPTLPSNSSRPSGSLSSRSFWLGICLAGGAISLSVLGMMIQPGENASNGLPPGPPRFVTANSVDSSFDERLMEDARQNTRPLQLVELTNHDGRPAYRIRATTYGDEILVDYVTGKLIAIKELPGKFPLPAPPMGETIISSS